MIEGLRLMQLSNPKGGSLWWIEAVNDQRGSRGDSVPQPGLFDLVLLFRNDFETDGFYIADVNLTFTGHSGPALTAIHFVTPCQLRVVLAHPSQTMAVRTFCHHAACLNSRKAQSPG